MLRHPEVANFFQKKDKLKKKHLRLTKAALLADKISENSLIIKMILSDYQTDNVTVYEIERVIRTLRGLFLDVNISNADGMAGLISVLLPSNLPLYSFVVFALIPSMFCAHVCVRPNSILQENNIITRIYEALELETLFPEVQVINQDHAGFSQYIRSSDMVIFTGKPSNADKLLQEMKEESLLVINGSGHNPVVITDSADIDEAVDDTVLLKGFNGGQDCAGPDAILVHADVAHAFIKKFQEKFTALKTGQFQHIETQVGPIHRFSELQKFAGIFHSNSKDIVSGGIIDFRNGIVSPTVVVRGIERYPNYKEMYGPVAFIHPYKTDRDLSYYFQDFDGRYNANRMYVSVYGASEYISMRDDKAKPGLSGNVGIVLHNETIHDVEIGYKAYGGYSLGASGVIKKSKNGIQRTAMPTLIPDILVKYIINKYDLPMQNEQGSTQDEAPVSSSTLHAQAINPVLDHFKQIALDSFGDNLVFGFVFGSAAKGKLKTKGQEQDDLDTFICIKDANDEAVSNYKNNLIQLHHHYGLKVDDAFPTEVMTLNKLKETIDHLSDLNVSLDKKITGYEYDHLFWTHALTDQKAGFIGQGRVMSSLIKQAMPHIYRWKNQIMEQLENIDELPQYLNEKFLGLSKVEVCEKLSKYNPHLIVHLGLNYDDNNTSVVFHK
jgi:acyl-CoA reductase-like NAD-dependent aldehyde dehydrogenase